jgi:adenylate cyclase
MAFLVILVRWGGLLQAWEWAVFDQSLRLRPEETQDRRIAIVGVDDLDLQKIGQAIVPDGVYADLIRKLKAMQPRAIGLDIYRDLPIEPGHQELVEVFKSTPNLVAIQKVVGDSPRELVGGPPALAGNFFQVGANDLIVDADNKVRRSFLYVQPDPERTFFSFGMLLAGAYLSADGIGPEEDPDTGTWRFGRTEFPALDPNYGGYVRGDMAGYQVLLNYRGGSQHFETVPMRDILDNKVPSTWGRDRIILIGAVSDSSNDLFFTPYSSGLLTLPERMAGVEIHAHTIGQILSSVLDDRPLIRSWPEYYEWLWILFWSTIGASFTWAWRSTGREKNFFFFPGKNLPP